MAWQLNPSTVSSGAPVRWTLSWPESRYPGIQVFQARPVPATGGAVIVSFGSHLQISDVTFEWRPTQGYIYRLTVTHRGGFSPGDYRLRGQKVD